MGVPATPKPAEVNETEAKEEFIEELEKEIEEEINSGDDVEDAS